MVSCSTFVDCPNYCNSRYGGENVAALRGRGEEILKFHKYAHSQFVNPALVISGELLHLLVAASANKRCHSPPSPSINKYHSCTINFINPAEYNDNEARPRNHANSFHNCQTLDTAFLCVK